MPLKDEIQFDGQFFSCASKMCLEICSLSLILIAGHDHVTGKLVHRLSDKIYRQRGSVVVVTVGLG